MIRRREPAKTNLLGILVKLPPPVFLIQQRNRRTNEEYTSFREQSPNLGFGFGDIKVCVKVLLQMKELAIDTVRTPMYFLLIK